ncbi:MAG: HD domain-containing protein [Acidobacteria bacterium]|nr:HD domain-containing protein [Acidobacteriota bacterium]
MRRSFAMHEKDSSGRVHHEEPDADWRSIYERDADRVIHSRAFKRLAGKTQVIAGRQSDHHRTRLTHSMEVGALCRSVARRLGLNEDLAACLGYAHDLGHPPLGHCGEDVLNEICGRFNDRFEHNRHTLTIVDEFEQKYACFPGLNLSYEVREGIVKHSPVKPAAAEELAGFHPELQPTLEAQLVDFCDEICYSYSDLDDALEMKFIRLDDIRNGLPEFNNVFMEMGSRYRVKRPELRFNETLRRLMSRTIQDLVDSTDLIIRRAGIETVADVRIQPEWVTHYSPAMADWMERLKKFLFRHYYQHESVLEDREYYMARIRQLFDLYHSDPKTLPPRYQARIQAGEMPLHRVIVYYIAGFTDFFLFQMIEKFGL